MRSETGGPFDFGALLTNPTKKTPEKEQAIIEALHAHPSKSRACRRVRINRSTLYVWMAEDPDFKARVDAAQELGIDAVEDALLQDATEHNTTAQIFALKTWRKAKYGEKVELTGKDEGPIEFVYQQYQPKPETS